MNCLTCNRPLPPPPWMRQDLCPHCSASLHACVYCVFHDPMSHNSCRETQAERVVDKERSNFCDYFKPGEKTGGPAGEDRAKETAKAAFEALFKK